MKFCHRYYFSFLLLCFRNVINTSFTINFHRTYGLELFINKGWKQILLKKLKLGSLFEHSNFRTIMSNHATGFWANCILMKAYLQNQLWCDTDNFFSFKSKVKCWLVQGKAGPTNTKWKYVTITLMISGKLQRQSLKPF